MPHLSTVSISLQVFPSLQVLRLTAVIKRACAFNHQIFGAATTLENKQKQEWPKHEATQAPLYGNQLVSA